MQFGPGDLEITIAHNDHLGFPMAPGLEFGCITVLSRNAVEEVKEVDGLWMDCSGWCWCRWMEVVYGHGAHEVQGALTSSISCIAFGGMP